MTATAAGEGLDFRFDIARSGNTFDAHRSSTSPRSTGSGRDEGASAARLLSEGELMSDHDALRGSPWRSDCRRTR